MSNRNMFFGVTLSGLNSTATWILDMTQYQALVVKQIMLGCEASYEEDNVIEVTSSGNLSLIAPLKAGVNRAVNPKITFHEPRITFTLKEGNGPVHLIGQIYPNFVGHK